MDTIDNVVTDVPVTRKITAYWNLQLLALQLKPRGFTPSVNGCNFRMDTSIADYPVVFEIDYIDPKDSSSDSQYKAKLVTKGEVPTDVREEAVTPEAKVAPVNVPAGAMTTLPEAAVINPLALTVKVGMEVDEPKLPVLLLTVAKVAANDPVPDPVTSPVKVIVWSPVLVPLDEPEKLEAERAPAMVRAPAEVSLLEEEKN